MNAVLERNRASKPTSPSDAEITQPTSLDEIRQILTDPKRYSSPIRPVGSGSSITRCVAANGGTVIDLSQMNRVLRIEPDTVTVQPGVTLPELAEILNDEGMELIGGFDLANKTVGGAVCAPGLEATIAGHVGQFCGHATQLKVVSAVGKKFAVTNKTPSLLALLRLSYGLLGVVYEITLRIRPVQGFLVHTAKASFKDLAKLGQKLSTTTAGLKLHLLPFRDRVYLELRQASARAGRGSRYAWRFKDWAQYCVLPGAARSLARAIPIRRLRYPLIDNLSEATQSLVNNSLVKTGSNATEQSGRFRSLGQHSFSYCTWAFPAAQFALVALAYKSFSKEHYARTRFRCDMPTVSFRLHQDRSSLLSPSFDGPLFTLSPMSTQVTGWEEFVFHFAEFAMKHGGIPFFNQTPNATSEYVSACFNKRLEFFNKMRRELDPDDRLLNPYFSTYMSS